MERWEIISGELEADLSRPLERLGFGRVFISDHRTASQLIFQREAARTVPKCAQPIILAYGTCASAKFSRHWSALGRRVAVRSLRQIPQRRQLRGLTRL